jgi:serine/threonine-protein kinase HipA
MNPPDLSSVRAVAVADVYKAGHRAAQLLREPGGVTFRYLPEYLSSATCPVATTLPLSDQPVVTPAGAVPPFFAGLLPEGRRLSSLRRAVKTSADDDLSLLLAVGSDPVGDVQIVPEGRPAVGAEALVTVDASFEEVSFTDILGRAGIVDPVALAGVQDKASARMLSVPVGRRDRRYILKIDPPEYPHVVVNEAFFLRLAADSGVQAVNAEVVHDADGRPGLLVERFDRVAGPDGAVRPLAVEDGAQVLGRYPADKYSVNSEQLAAAVARLCPARLVALRAVFTQMCFAWLTGNGDLHAKNISVLATAEGEWRVAPAYDLPSTLPYRDHTLALSMCGRTQGLSRRTLLEFAAAIGLPERAARRALDDLLAGTADVMRRIDEAGLPFTAQMKDLLRRGLRNRRAAALPSA